MVKAFLAMVIEQQPLDMIKSAIQPDTFIMAQNTMYGNAENKPF
jgi:hypothetical protein